MGEGWPIVKYRDTLQSPVRKQLNRSWCHLDCELGLAQGIMNYVGVQIPHPTRRGNFVKHKDFLPWAAQKQLKRSICRLGCGLGQGQAEGSTSSIVFATWRQCAHMGGHIGATWRIRLNRPSAAVLQSYVKLLWPCITFMTGCWLTQMWLLASVHWICW